MHVIIKNTPPPKRETVVLGKLFPIMNEQEQSSGLTHAVEEGAVIRDQAVEAKVVKGRRGRRPVATSEVAETK